MKIIHNKIKVLCANQTIRSKRSLRYLGVQIHAKLGFYEHAKLVADRVTVVSRQLKYLMPKQREPKHRSRQLLVSVITSRLVYVAPLWSDFILAKGWKKIAAVHRWSQLQVACCYRMVSYKAVALVSGVAPVHLMAIKCTDIYNGQNKYKARSKLIASWQQE